MEGGGEESIKQEIFTTSVSEDTPENLFFRGSIPDAIVGAQTGKKVLIVFVAGTDEESVKLEQSTWQDSQVVKEVQQQCLVLRLEHGSTDAANFAALYPVRHVPTIMLLGLKGSVLHQLEGYKSAEEFLGPLQEAVGTFNDQKQLQSAADASAMFALISGSNMSATSSVTPSGMPRRPSPGESSGSAQRQPPASKDPEDATTTANVTDQVVDTPKGDTPHVAASAVLGRTVSSVLIPHSHPDTARATLDIHQGEVSEKPEARKDTSGVSESASLNMEQGDLHCQEGNAHSQATAEASSGVEKKNTSGVQIPVEKPSGRKMGPFLLQIKLTNGETIRGTFESSNVLRAVKEFVDENRTDGRSSYHLAVPFPRKMLSDEDFGKTLLELELGPRSALILVPSNSTTVPLLRPALSVNQPTASISQRDAPMSGSLIGKLLSYFNPFAYFGGGAVAADRQDSPSGSTWQYNSNPALGRTLREGLQPPLSGSNQPLSPFASPNNSGGAQRGEGSGAGHLTQRKGWGLGGNVHTLQHDEDDYPPRGNTYWNGNSTQFGGDDESKQD